MPQALAVCAKINKTSHDVASKLPVASRLTLPDGSLADGSLADFPARSSRVELGLPRLTDLTGTHGARGALRGSGLGSFERPRVLLRGSRGPFKGPRVLLKGPGVLLKNPGILLKDPGVFLKDPGVL